MIGRGDSNVRRMVRDKEEKEEGGEGRVRKGEGGIERVGRG